MANQIKTNFFQPDYCFIPDTFFELADVDHVSSIENTEELLQKFCKHSHPEILCCITVYNEPAEALLYSLVGIIKNINYLVSTGNSSLASQITICIIFDGRNKISASTATLIKDLNLYDLEKVEPGAGVHVFNTRLDNKKLKQCLDRVTGSVMSDKYATSVYRTAQRYEGMNLSNYIEEENENKEQVLPRVLLCIKEHNAGKLNSHWWFFMVFSRSLSPKYCIQMDAGTVPTAGCIHSLWLHMEQHQNVAGTASFTFTPKPRTLWNMLSNWQSAYFSVEKVLNFPAEVVAGYLSILPGQLSMLRWKALYPQQSEQFVKEGQGFPLKGYFRGLKKLGLIESNMFLAEDRIIGFEIVTNSSHSWKIAFVPSAVVITDVCPSLSELLQQRRRWINSVFTVQLWMSLQCFKYLRNSRIKLNDKFRFLTASTYHFLAALFTWFYPATIYASVILIYIYIKSILGNNFQPFTSIIDLSFFLEICSLTFILIFAKLYKRQNYFLSFNITSRVLFSVIIIAALLCAYFWTGYSALLNVPLGYCILPILVCFGIALRGQWFLKQTWKSLILYFLIDSPVLLVLRAYAFHNIHDVSWGTKGLTEGSQQLKKRRRNFRNKFIFAWFLTNFILIITFIKFPKAQIFLILLYAFYSAFNIFSGILFMLRARFLKLNE